MELVNTGWNEAWERGGIVFRVPNSGMQRRSLSAIAKLPEEKGTSQRYVYTEFKMRHFVFTLSLFTRFFEASC
jgi:hypothetical protein